MTASNRDEASGTGEDARLVSLDEQLRAAHRAEAERTAPAALPGAMGSWGGKGAGQGNRVISILVGYPFGGGLIGWLIDAWLHTRPWVMLAMLFLGFAAGCLVIWRVAQERPE